MDFTGTLLRNILKPLFHLPGRAAIDLLASWVGNCNVGVVLTTKQYESGYYTDREAILIASCFSATSLPFCLVIAAIMGVDQYFIQLYFILSLVGTLSAMIMSRIWPLEGKWKDEYYPPVGRKVQEVHPVGISRSRWALHQAIKRAEKGPPSSSWFQMEYSYSSISFSHWYQLPCASEHWPAVCHPILHSSNGLPCRFSGISNSVV